MISTRHWKERRVFWHALVFWAWLASFAFGFAASELFHAPNCGERLALRGAAHASSAHLSVSHAVSIDAQCAACAFQLAAQGLFAPFFALAPPLFLSVALALAFSVYPNLCAPILCARGPPAPVI